MCSFNIKVDSNSPRVATNSWTAKKGATGEILEGFISTSNYHCIDVEVIIEEQEALFPGDVQVAWKFFDDPTNDITWSSIRSTHGSDANESNLTYCRQVVHISLQLIVLICGHLKKANSTHARGY